MKNLQEKLKALKREWKPYEANESEVYNKAIDNAISLIKNEQKKCNHLISTALYKNKKLQGYKCNQCKKIQKVNPQYLKGKKQ